MCQHITRNIDAKIVELNKELEHLKGLTVYISQLDEKDRQISVIEEKIELLLSVVDK